MKALCYVRVSTEEQRDSGLGVEVQRRALEAACRMRHWEAEFVEDLGYSGKNMKRPGIGRALDMLTAGEAGALLVYRLDRLSRSVIDFAGLVERAKRQGWRLVVLDCDVDTSTAAGEMMANVMATFAQFERKRIAERTREALRMARQNGLKLGRPSVVPAEVVERVRVRREEGASYRTIADELNREGVATGHGGAAWHPSTVRGLAARL